MVPDLKLLLINSFPSSLLNRHQLNSDSILSSTRADNDNQWDKSWNKTEKKLTIDNYWTENQKREEWRQINLPI